MLGLDRDLLFEIADKLVFCGSDSINSSNLADGIKFMMINRACKRAFLSQFTLVRTVYLHTSFKTTFEESDCQREKSTCYMTDERDKWLVALLIQNGKFNPKRIVFDAMYHGNRENQVNELKELSAIECFSTLLGLNRGGLDLSDYQGPEFLADRLQVYLSRERFGDFNKLLGLNARSMLVPLLKGEHTWFPEEGFFPLMVANRVEDFTIVLNSEEFGDNFDSVFSTTKCVQLLNYVMSCCVNLKKLGVFDFISESKEEDYSLEDMLQAVNKVKDIVMPKLVKDGRFIQVDLISDKTFVNTDFELLRTENKGLLAMGVQCTFSNNLSSAVQSESIFELSFMIQQLKSSNAELYDEEVLTDSDSGSDDEGILSDSGSVSSEE